MDVLKLREGTRADFLVRPIGVTADTWLPVQLKSTVTPTSRGEYRFGFPTDYSGMVILCVYVPEEILWVFDGKLSTMVSGVNMHKNSKYAYARVSKTELGSYLSDLFVGNNFPIVTFGDANIPIGSSQQTEYKHQLIRQRELSQLLKFEYPELEGQVFDFMVNGKYRVQEKVGRISKIVTATLCVTLARSAGKRCYEKGDNDFYWIACPDTDTFYVFPESILIEKGYISTTETPCKPQTIRLHYEATTEADITSCPFKDTWAFPYRYKYSNLDVGKLQEVFM